jgi:hypothetical protein
MLGSWDRYGVCGSIPNAVVYSGLRNWDKAMMFLNRAFDNREVNFIFAPSSPYFAPLRSDPAFVALLKRAGLSRSGAQG